MKRLVAFFVVFVLFFPSIASSAPPLQEYQGVITSPRANASLRGLVAINGTANHPNLWKYEVRITAGLNPNVPDDQWFRLVVVENQPIFDSQLAVWDTTFSPDGPYILRLRVVRNDGNWQDFDVFPVNVENNVPTPAPPTPIPPSPTAIIIPTVPPPTSTPLPPPPTIPPPPPPPPPPTETVPPPPTETATAEASQTPTPIESETPIPTASESEAATPTQSQTATPNTSETATPSQSESPTPTESETPSIEEEGTLTASPTVTDTIAVPSGTPFTATPDPNQPTETITATATATATLTATGTPIVNATLVPSDTQSAPVETVTTTLAKDATATAIVIDQPIILVPTASGVAGNAENSNPVATRPANDGLGLPSFAPNINGVVSASSITGACFAGAAFTTSIFLLVGLLFLLKSLLRLFY